MRRKVRKLGSMMRRGARRLAHGIANILPKPTICGTSVRAVRPIEGIIVFARLPNPTVDYYLTARLAAPGMPPSRVVDIRDPSIAALEAEGTFVLVCRYANRRVLAWIEKNSAALTGVGYFTDDDVGAVVTGAEAAIGYRFFLYQRGLAPLRRLNRHIDHVWTATPALAEAIGGVRTRVLPPAPHPSMWKTASSDRVARHPDDPTIRIVYHATGVHLSEHRFLAPIVAEVLAQRPHAVFEVTADARARGLWADMERVTLLEPTSWPEYFDRTRRERADIVLVPLVRSRANKARAGTKRIDIVRLGGAGVFSRSDAYGTDGETGEIILPNRRRLWIARIIELIDGEELRARAAEATRRAVAAMTEEAGSGFPGLDVGMSPARTAAGRRLAAPAAPETTLEHPSLVGV